MKKFQGDIMIKGLTQQQTIRFMAGLGPLLSLLGKIESAEIKKLIQPLQNDYPTAVCAAEEETKPFGVTLKAILKQLKQIKEPSDELVVIIKSVETQVTDLDLPKTKYGVVVDAEALTKLLRGLEKLEDQPTEVKKAIRLLKHMLGTDEEEQKADLPVYDIGKIKASDKPGVYLARLIRAGEALDGKIWPDTVLEKAVEDKLFEGVPVNVITYHGDIATVDHHLPSDFTFCGDISGNQVGFVKDSYWDTDEKAAFGMVYITDPARRALIDVSLDEKVTPPGMSIYASGALAEDKKVQNVDLVYSMDLVTFPAADGAILSKALQAALATSSTKVTTTDSLRNITGNVLPLTKSPVSSAKPIQKGAVLEQKVFESRVEALEKKLTETESLEYVKEKLLTSGLPDNIRQQILTEAEKSKLTPVQIDAFIAYNVALVANMVGDSAQQTVAAGVENDLSSVDEQPKLHQVLANVLGVKNSKK